MKAPVKVLRMLAALVIGLCSASANPLKVPTQARFDLIASSSVGSLTNGQVILGTGSFGRQTWRAANEQPGSYTVNLNLRRYGWHHVGFSFVPASNGFVALTLMGPWEEVSPGMIYQQEVLWDNLQASGTTLANPSFERTSFGVVMYWTNTGGPYQIETGPETPVEGARYVRTWHNVSLSGSLSVTGGVPVTLSFYARPYVPTNMEDMVRIFDQNTPAHQASRKFMRGVNLGNYLEAAAGETTISYTNADFDAIRSEGFDHVRLPIAWQYYTGPAPGYTLSNSIFVRADFLISNALIRGLGVIIDTHHFGDLTTAPSLWTNKFYAIWQQVAAYYAGSSSKLVFELLNEPKDAATAAVMNPIYAEAIRKIRQTNPTRTIFVPAGTFNTADCLPDLRLPSNDSNLVVTVHCYDPFLFTHQGASWALPDSATTGILYPGPPVTPLTPNVSVRNIAWITNWIRGYNTQPTVSNPSSPVAFSNVLQLAREWSDYYGRPVHVGEFGCYIAADAVSRSRFYTDIRSTMDALGLGWAMWDWKAGFRYWDDTSKVPCAGMRDAMFPKPRLALSGVGKFEVNGAVCKTYRIERALGLGTNGWSGVATQTLSQPKLIFIDPHTNFATGFYRVQWMK